jgi:hypothetical protein
VSREELERLVWRYMPRDLRVERKDGTRLIVRRNASTQRAELIQLAVLPDADLFAALPAVVQDECKESFSAYIAGEKAQRSA